MNRFPTFRLAPLTFLFALLLLLIHETAWVIGGKEAVAALAVACSTKQLLRHGAWWTLLTSGFVHQGWSHLLHSVLAILAFGPWLEPRLGTKRMGLLILVAIVVGGWAGVIFERMGGYGSSSVPFALGGALISRPIWTGKDGLRRYSGLWIVFVYIVTTYYIDGPYGLFVSHAGHLGGLFSGLCFGTIRWREDPAIVPPRARLRHAGAVAMVVLTLLGAEAMRPRWTILQHWADARQAEKVGDLALAEKNWWAVICTADPAWAFDAVFIDDAARYRLRRKQPRAAIDLLSTIAFVGGTPKIHRDIGFLRARLDPPDMRGALDAWRKSYHTAPNQADVLDAMAQAKVFTDDSLLYRPGQAVDLARRAVYADGMQNAWFMRTLGVALFEDDRYDEALGWMQHAIAHADSASKITFRTDLEGMRTWLRENPPDSTGAAS